VTEQVVAGIIRDALREKPDGIEHIPTLEDSHVYRAEMSSGAVFFKSEHEGHSIDVAAWAYVKAATAGVPVPDVLHVDLSRERWPEEFMIVTAVGGSDLLHDPLDGDDLWRAIAGYGELLRRLHTIELEGFGELEFAPAKVGDPVGEFADYASAMRHSLDWALPYLIEKKLVSHEQVERIQNVLERSGEVVTAPNTGVLLHDDAGLDHLFVDRTSMEITGLIDFEPRSDDPIRDLAIFAYYYPGLAPHLFDGYGPVPDDVELRMKLYRLLRAVGSARWEHERRLDVADPLAEIEQQSRELNGMLA
jgi:aminoglycoside phosphotransferase (APT) family kinase protein